MKKLTVLAVVAAFVLIGGNLMALPTPPAGFELNNAPYWTLTDFDTVDADFKLEFEEAAYDSDFGVFAFGDASNKLQIFAASDEPPTPVLGTRSVDFRFEGGVWQARVLQGNVEISGWQDFGTTFGFYFGVYKDDGDSTLDYTFYSDSSLNSHDVGVQHIAIAYSELSHDAIIYLDDQLLSTPADRDFNDMIVVADDLKPVPEPGTLLLLGAGLVGLVGLRKRLQK